MSDDRMLSTQDIADELHVSTKTVRRWIIDGDLPALDLGSVYRIDPADYEAWKKSRETSK